MELLWKVVTLLCLFKIVVGHRTIMGHGFLKGCLWVPLPCYFTRGEAMASSYDVRLGG